MDSSELWNKSLDILSRREHSVIELKTKLKRFDPFSQDLNDVIQRLIEAKFLDDERFAATFIKFSTYFFEKV